MVREIVIAAALARCVEGWGRTWERERKREKEEGERESSKGGSRDIDRARRGGSGKT
jgi:hypothetical protein